MIGLITTLEILFVLSSMGALLLGVSYLSIKEQQGASFVPREFNFLIKDLAKYCIICFCVMLITFIGLKGL